MTIALAILALGFLVLIHEAGHFALARLFKMKVETFSIGFGPALLSWQGKKTEYRLAMVPLGGYVRIAGMAPGDGSDETSPDSFAQKPLWQRMLVLVAGSFTNWLFAFALLTSLLVVGMPRAVDEPVIGTVKSGSAAAAAGLLPDDRIVSIDQKPLKTWVEMSEAIRAHKAVAMQLVVRRGASDLNVVATPSAEGVLGITPATQLERYPFGEAASLAAGQTVKVLAGTLMGLKELITGSKDAQLMGPVGIVSHTVEAAKSSWLSLLAMMVTISLALAFMNLLPFPALDGGRLLFVLIAMVRRRPVDPRVEAVVHGVGMLVLFCLILIATYGDIGRHFAAKHAEEKAPPAQTQQQQAPAQP